MTSTTLDRTPSRWFRLIASGLALAVGLHAFAPSALAGALSSSVYLAESTREADLATIQSTLENKVVQERLAELGFTPLEIQQRLAHATDAELHQLATESASLAAGGVAGLIVTVLLIILLVVVIMRITHHQPIVMTDVAAA